MNLTTLLRQPIKINFLTPMPPQSNESILRTQIINLPPPLIPNQLAASHLRTRSRKQPRYHLPQLPKTDSSGIGIFPANCLSMLNESLLLPRRHTPTHTHGETSSMMQLKEIYSRARVRLGSSGVDFEKRRERRRRRTE